MVKVRDFFTDHNSAGPVEDCKRRGSSVFRVQGRNDGNSERIP